MKGHFKRPVCESCGKDFIDKGALKNHREKVHEGKDPARPWEICGAFAGRERGQ